MAPITATGIFLLVSSAVTLPVLAQPYPWDSRNISADNWVCAGDYAITFGTQKVTCGTEVRIREGM